MKSYFKMIFAAALIGFSTSANAIDRHSLAQYAASLKGLKKEQLKAALYDIMKQKQCSFMVENRKERGMDSGILTVIRRQMSVITATVTRSSTLEIRTMEKLSRV